MEQNLGNLGMGLMFALAVIGICVGIKSVLGARQSATEKINQETESKILILTAMIVTKGLYAFLIYILHGEGAIESPDIWFSNTLVYGVVFCSVAVLQGYINANGVKKMLQGDTSVEVVYATLTHTMIYAALPEFFAILALVSSFMIQA